MTRTGEEVKAKYKKQWTRAPARVSLYKTPCPPDLPLFRGCWRQPAAAAVFTPAVCRACAASQASLPLLAPEAALRSSTLRRSIRPRRACGKFDEWQAGRFPAVSARGIPRCGATRGDCRGSRQPTFAHQHSERTAVTHTALRLSSFGHFGRRRTKRCPPTWGTSLHRGYFLTACEEGHIEFTKERACCHRRQRHHLPKWG